MRLAQMIATKDFRANAAILASGRLLRIRRVCRLCQLSRSTGFPARRKNES
jgi:predicted DNA-binding transcriptional regulator AlpA